MTARRHVPPYSLGNHPSHTQREDQKNGAAARGERVADRVAHIDDWSESSDVAEVTAHTVTSTAGTIASPGHATEATRVSAPSARDLDASYAAAERDAANMGWGDREETSTQLWNGMPKARQGLAEDLPKGRGDASGRRVVSSDYVRRAPESDSAVPHMRNSRLPSEARPRLPSPSVAPGEAKAEAKGVGARSFGSSPDYATSPRSSRITAEYSPAGRTQRLPAYKPSPELEASALEATAPAAASDASHLSALSALSAMEQLQEQLVESMERARIQESRALAAEQRAQRAEAHAGGQVPQTPADVEREEELQELREQLQLAQERIRRTEASVDEAQSSEDLVLQARKRLIQASELAPVAPRAKSFSVGVVAAGLGACLLLSALATYLMFVSPLKKQVTIQQQQEQLDREQHERALTTLKTQRDADKQGLETEAETLRSQLKVARGETAPAAPAADGGDGKVAASTRSAKSIAHRYRRAKAAEQQNASDDAAEAAPKAKSSKAKASADDTDALGGI
jgi:hypothetical protein